MRRFHMLKRYCGLFWLGVCPDTWKEEFCDLFAHFTSTNMPSKNNYSYVVELHLEFNNYFGGFMAP